MQLGELQNQIHRFNKRDASIVAISVDPPMDSLAMVERLGLQFDLASDSDQSVIQSFKVQNPDTQELALHAVYILSREGKVVYRKVGLRRPVSAELIDAIDASLGRYPQPSDAKPAERINVAYPQNNFQAVMEVSGVSGLPTQVDPSRLAVVSKLVRDGRSDDAVFAFRRFLSDSSITDEQVLFDTVNWFVRDLFYPQGSEAIAAGVDLRRRLDLVAEREAAQASAQNSAEQDDALHKLALARATLTRARALVSKNADEWRLRSVKTTLRSYRELVRSYLRSNES